MCRHTLSLLVLGLLLPACQSAAGITASRPSAYAGSSDTSTPLFATRQDVPGGSTQAEDESEASEAEGWNFTVSAYAWIASTSGYVENSNTTLWPISIC